MNSGRTLVGRVATVLEQVENCDVAVMADMRDWFFRQSLNATGKRANVCFGAMQLIDNFAINTRSNKKLNKEQIKAALAKKISR